ncbi:MAG: branched-chain amino acid ABC transporter substrate-binding protein [Spirochaetia bacterium]
MKGKLFISVILAVLLPAAIFAGGDSETGPIRIGVPGAHSGDLASYGLPTVHAAELVVSDVNENGGVNGRQIELIVEDEQCIPEIATNTAAKLVGDNVVAVIGHICSGATRAAMGIYLDEDIVAISPSATSPPLTQSGEYPNFFRTIAPDDAQAELQVDFAVNELGLENIAILHDRGDYGKGLAEFVQDYIEENPDAEVTLFDGITVGAVDYSSIINRVASSGADGLIYGGYHPEAARLVTQMRDQGIEIPFISGDGVKDETFIAVAGDAAEGVYATSPVDTSSNPMAQAATQAHIEEYGEEPGPFFMNAYAAALAIVNAIDVADSTEYEAITEALRSTYVETPLGSISFDERGDAIGVGFAMNQVQNGVYREVE